MKNLTALTTIFSISTLMAFEAIAQNTTTGEWPAPPGPFQIQKQQQFSASGQPIWMHNQPVPYWMQTPSKAANPTTPGPQRDDNPPATAGGHFQVQAGFHSNTQGQTDNVNRSANRPWNRPQWSRPMYGPWNNFGYPPAYGFPGNYPRFPNRPVYGFFPGYSGRPDYPVQNMPQR